MKKKFLVAACAATMAMGCAMTANAADTESGLVGYYTFDDTLANQASTNGGSAKLHGGAGDTWNSNATGTENYTVGKNGKAYEFLGDGTTRGEGLELDVKLSKAFTISFWVNADTVNSATSMAFSPISLEAGLNIADNWFGKTFPTVRIWGLTTKDAYLDYWIPNGEADALCGAWHYITVTCDEKGNTNLYFDAFNAAPTKTIQVGAFEGKDLFLGINFWDKSFDGKMDDVAFYNRALTQEDVTALYQNSGRPVVDSNQVNTDPSVYVQYKKQTDGKYTVRVVGEVSLEGTFAESVNNTYNGVGFRCAKSASAVAKAESYASTVVFKSLVANGATVTAADGKYFVVTEITDVAKDATIYASPVYVKADKTVGTFTNKEYTIKMADIIK